MNEDQKAVRQSLSQFIGTIIETSSYNGQEARHEVVAMLLEEALSLSRDENGHNLFILKPFYRAMIHILEDRKSQLSGLPEGTYKKSIQELDEAIKTLKKVVD